MVSYHRGCRSLESLRCRSRHTSRHITRRLGLAFCYKGLLSCVADVVTGASTSANLASGDSQEAATMPPLPLQFPKHPGRAAIVNPRSMPRIHNVERPGMPHTFPPATHLQRGLPTIHSSSGSRHRRRGSDSSSSSSGSSSSASSSDDDSSSDESDDTDDRHGHSRSHHHPHAHSHSRYR